MSQILYGRSDVFSIVITEVNKRATIINQPNLQLTHTQPLLTTAPQNEGAE